MEFELSPSGVQIPDSDLLADVRRVAAQLGKNTVTKRDYVKHGSIGQQTVAHRFGSWATALKRAGLSAHPAPLSPNQCTTDLQRVATELGKTSVTLSEYRAHGNYSERPFIRNFGTWEKALKKAGLSCSPQFHPRVPDEDYFENIERIWIALGRQPKYSEVEKPLSTFSAGAYENRFGSWRKALEAFVRFVAQDQSRAIAEEPLEPTQTPLAPTAQPNGSVK